jgi:hypothetical protein
LSKKEIVCIIVKVLIVTLFKQTISILRAFGLKETLRRTFYYSTLITFRESLYQKHIVNCIVKYAKGYPTFIDIGANRGTVTVAVAHLFESLIAIEPLQENFSQLLSNVSAHKIKNCILLPLALGEKPGTKKYTIARETLIPQDLYQAFCRLKL